MKVYWEILFFLVILFLSGSTIYGSEIFNYDGAQDAIDEYTLSEFNINDTVDKLKKGDGTSWIQNVINIIKINLVKEISYNKDSLIKIVFVAIGAAVLSNFSAAFGGDGASEMGVMMSYIILTGYLLAGFLAIYNVAEETISCVGMFMETMIPAYFISMSATGATASAATLYEIALFVVTLVCKILEEFVIPAVMIYVVIMIVDNIQSKKHLSKLGELVKMIILWTLKTIMAIVIGINVIQSIILPSVDAITGKTATKVVSLIPGIGSSAGTVAELIVGSGMVIKNAIGTTVVIGLIIICVVPILKIFVYVLMYKVTSALIEPVADGRIAESVEAVTEGGRLLLKVTVYGVALFAVSIAIICIATNVR